MDFVFSHYSYFLDISESIHLKIGRKSHETKCNGLNLILLNLIVVTVYVVIQVDRMKVDAIKILLIMLFKKRSSQCYYSY